MLKIFCVFNFHTRWRVQKFFKKENFPNYGMGFSALLHSQTPTHTKIIVPEAHFHTESVATSPVVIWTKNGEVIQICIPTDTTRPYYNIEASLKALASSELGGGWHWSHWPKGWSRHWGLRSFLTGKVVMEGLVAEVGKHLALVRKGKEQVVINKARIDWLEFQLRPLQMRL